MEERACLHCVLYHGKLQRKSAVASGGCVLRVAWLWTEMEGRRLEDGGGSVGPQGPLVEMMRGLGAGRWACYIWRSIVTSGKGRPGHLFTSSTFKYIIKIYPSVSVTLAQA